MRTGLFRRRGDDACARRTRRTGCVDTRLDATAQGRGGFGPDNQPVFTTTAAVFRSLGWLMWRACYPLNGVLGILPAGAVRGDASGGALGLAYCAFGVIRSTLSERITLVEQWESALQRLLARQRQVVRLAQPQSHFVARCLQAVAGNSSPDASPERTKKSPTCGALIGVYGGSDDLKTETINFLNL